MEPEGVAPSSPVCRASILLLNYGPVSRVVGLEGVAPPPLECETSILLLNYSPVREVGRSRTFVAGMSDQHSDC